MNGGCIQFKKHPTNSVLQDIMVFFFRKDAPSLKKEKKIQFDFTLLHSSVVELNIMQCSLIKQWHIAICSGIYWSWSSLVHTICDHRPHGKFLINLSRSLSSPSPDHCTSRDPLSQPPGVHYQVRCTLNVAADYELLGHLKLLCLQLSLKKAV